LGSPDDVRVNLGGKGPDAGKEGMVYHVKDVRSGKELELRVNALSEYFPQASRMNGILGEYGSVNLKAGTHVDLNFSFWDPQTGEPAYLQHVAFTFFDLDQDSTRRVSEYVIADGFTYAMKEPTSELMQDDGTDLNDGRVKFSASTSGTGQDNPKDPDHLNQQQKDRAITFFYDSVRHFKVTIGATGKDLDSPRWFTFVGRPTLLCTPTVDSNQSPASVVPQRPRLETLANEPGEKAESYLGKGGMFVKWLAKVGQKVRFDDPIALVKLPDGRMDLLRASTQGRLAAVQKDLQLFDNIADRVPNSVLAVVKEDVRLFKLKAFPPAEAPLEVDQAGLIFDEWLVQPDQSVKYGEPVAKFFGPDGTVKTLRSPQTGMILSVAALEKGDSISLRLPPGDRTIAVIQLPPKLASLPVNDGEVAVTVHPPPEFGTKVLSWVKGTGDSVQEGEAILTLRTIYMKSIEVKAPISGIIKSRLPLRIGEQLADRMQEGDNVIAVIEGAETLSPLPFVKGAVSVGSPPGVFQAWSAAVGDELKEGDPIATVFSSNGEAVIPAPRDGTLVSMQSLRSGQRMDSFVHQAIAVLQKPEKFTPLAVAGGRAPVVSAPGEIFQGWKVRVGDVVRPNTEIAAVKYSGSEGVQRILAPISGVVEALQPLEFGDSIDDHTDQPIAVIARVDLLSRGERQEQPKDNSITPLAKLSPANRTHSTNKAVSAEPSDIFVRWSAGVGDRVRDGSTVAVVKRTIEVGGRSEEIEATLHAPHAGTLVFRQPLSHGDLVSDRLANGDTTIALVDGRQAAPVRGPQDLSVVLPEAALQGHFTEWAVKTGDYVNLGDEVAVIELPLNLQSRKLEAGVTGGHVKRFQVQSPAEGLVTWRAEIASIQSIEDAVYGGSIAVIRVSPGGLMGLLTGSSSSGIFGWRLVLAALALVCCCGSALVAKLAPQFAPPQLLPKSVRMPNEARCMQTIVGELDSVPFVNTETPPEEREGLTVSDNKVVAGSMTVKNVDYDAVRENPALEEAFESECKNTIACQAGAAPASVNVTLSRGSVKVAYKISTPFIASQDVRNSLTAAINSGSLSTELLIALGTVPGIDHATTGRMSITSISKPMEELRFDVVSAYKGDAVEENEPQKEPEGVRFDFDDHNGTVHTRYVRHRPLGVSFRRQAPITVNGFHYNSYARSLGVELGWTIVRVGNRQVGGASQDLVEVKKTIHEALKRNQVYPLRFECKKPIGGGRFSNLTQVFEVEYQPVGLTFVRDKMPLVVANVQPGSAAADAGLQEGMQIVQVCDEDMKATSYKTILAHLQDGARLLDPKDPEKATKHWRKLSGLDPKDVALSSRSRSCRTPLLSPCDDERADSALHTV
jgi:biotin carboxyl carrier protein